MFKLVANLTCWWPVKIMEPDSDRPGKYIEREFEVEFQILDREETRRIDDLRVELLKTAEKDTSDEGLRKSQAELDAYDMKAFRRVLKNWRGIIDENDNPVPFTEEAFAAAMKHDRVRVGLNRAYQEAISQDKARLGN